MDLKDLMKKNGSEKGFEVIDEAVFLNEILGVETHPETDDLPQLKREVMRICKYCGHSYGEDFYPKHCGKHGNGRALQDGCCEDYVLTYWCSDCAHWHEYNRDGYKRHYCEIMDREMRNERHNEHRPCSEFDIRIKGTRFVRTDKGFVRVKIEQPGFNSSGWLDKLDI